MSASNRGMDKSTNTPNTVRAERTTNVTSIPRIVADRDAEESSKCSDGVLSAFSSCNFILMV